MNMINTFLQLAVYIQRVKVAFFAVTLIAGINAANASASWVTDTIDYTVGIDVGYDTSIAVDSSGKLHISYYDITNRDLKYATNATGAWVSETVDGSGSVGGFTSIAIDSNDKIHISYYYSYYDDINGDLKYATNATGAWVPETVDHTEGEDVGYDTSIEIDSNNNVHISYLDLGNGYLKYASNATGGWVPETVDNSGSVGGYTSIAKDSNDKLHISYYDFTNGALMYATNATGAWVSETVDGSGTVGGYTSIATDSNDKIHISYYSYYDDINGDLKYATNATGAWVPETIDHTDGEDVGSDTSIVIDSNSKVHISYLDFTNSNLKYASNATGGWVPETVDNSGSVGGYTSIAASKEVHISYYDYSKGALMYARAFTISLDNAVVAAGQTYYSFSIIVASWTSLSDTTVGLKEYRIAIGTTSGGTDIMNWTSTGVPSYTTGDISSDNFGKTLYISIKAVDNSGNEGSILTKAFVYTPADINSKSGQGDGRVDGFDLGKLGIAFGSSTGGGADINRDGKVDGNDLIVLGINFGKVKQ